MGPGRCDVCGERVPERWPFLVQVKSVGVGVASRANVVANVEAAHCDACARHFDVFRRRRLAAIATMVLAVLLFGPVTALATGLVGRAGGFVALALVTIPVALQFARLAAWHADLRERLGDELLDDLARSLPHAPGVLSWREVRVIPGWPRALERHHTLADLRAQKRALH